MAGGLGTANGTANTQFQSATNYGQNTQNNPWAPAIGILSQNSQQPNGAQGPGYTIPQGGSMPSMIQHASDIYNQLLGPSAAQSQALDQGIQDARSLPNFGGQVANMASDLMNNNSTINSPLMQYLQPNYLNPMTAPGMAPYLTALQNNITNQVNGQFAGAGRSLSPANSTALSYGLTSGMAPVILGQYNQDVAQQMNAINALRTNYGAGLGAAAAQPGIQMAPSQAQLQAANAATYLPAQAQMLAEGMMLPFAGLGGQSATQGFSNTQGTQNTQTTQTPSVLSQIGQIAGLFNPGSAGGTLLGLGGQSGGGAGLLG